MDQSHIRNFCIIAHIDHGKSTLADRLLEITGTVEKRKMKEQMLDQMDLERERGITIKLQPVRMTYNLQLTTYQLNLIDTPGHVDFTYEVSRSLAACEGAILVVDATQGIQAQTLANVKLALEHDLAIVPVVNKIDLPNADAEGTKRQIQELMNQLATKTGEIISVSGKTGQNVEQILQAVIERIPPPPGDPKKPLQALVFDSHFDKHRGVVAHFRVVNGTIKKGDSLLMMATRAAFTAGEVGYFAPEQRPAAELTAGEVGYVVSNSRELDTIRVGDTITGTAHTAIEPLPGYREIRPVVYASIFPEAGSDYPKLRDAMAKLKLNDAALQYEPENIPSLGFGFRTGFLGLLHMDIVRERLTREFGLDLVLTAPSVAYILKKSNGEEEIIYTPVKLPDMSQVAALSEPWVALEVITPDRYLGAVMNLATSRRGVYQTTNYLGPGRVDLRFEIPLSDIITDFYDKLKSVSAGYASMNYEFLDYRDGDLVRMDLLVAGDRVDALATIVHRSVAEAEGRRLTEKLKELIPKQQFPIALQAAIGGKIIARETIPAMRKDVTAGLYGGDVTRKMKLLKKQKKGKKRLTSVGKVDIPHEAFLQLLRR